MTVYLVISLPKIPYKHRIYMVLANPRCIRCVYDIFGREITVHTVIYGVYIQFWPTLVYHYWLSILRCITMAVWN